MLYLWICLGCLVFLIVGAFFLAFAIHKKSFGKRWEPNGITKYYEVSDFKGLIAEPVEIETQKGNLRGFFYKNQNALGMKGILVFSHGMWGSHRAYLQEIASLAEAGYVVLGFDYFGTEASDGQHLLGLGNSLLSLDYAIKYVKKTYPNEKIFVMGHSWGGYAAITICEFHKDLAGIVAMSPFLSLGSLYRHMLPKPLYPLIIFLRWIDGYYCGNYSKKNGKKTLKNTKIPTLILHSLDDPMIPYQISTARLQKEIKNDAISYHIVDGKKHNPDYSLEAIAYQKIVTEKLASLKEEDKPSFLRTVDYKKLGSLDKEIIDFIVDFLNQY